MGGSETSFRRRVSNGLLVQRPFDVEKRNSEQFGLKSLKSEYRMYYNNSKRRSIRVFCSIMRDTVLILKKSEKGWTRRNINIQRYVITQLSHKQMTAGLNHCGENQEEKRSIDNQAGTQFAESKLPKSG